MGIWYSDSRMDFYDITNEKVKKNALCVAVICKRDNLIDEKNGYSIVKVKNYGKSFKLCETEPFRDQPVITGWLCSGFLVKEDIIATAGDSVRECPVTDLRIVFGYKMSGPTRPVIQVPKKNIYKGVKIIHKVYNHTGNMSNWALVQLDRKVVGQSIARLCKKEISCDQPVYVIGYPSGLPLKYAPKARVRGIKESIFTADLNVYQGNGGSPVFNGDTHEVIGIVVHGDPRDFRWTGRCRTSVIYPNSEINSRGTQCTMVSTFVDFIDLSIESSEDYFENQMRKAVEERLYSEAKEYLQKIVKLSTERGERLIQEFGYICNFEKPEEDEENWSRFGNGHKTSPFESKDTIKKIFISYSHRDKKYVNRLVGDLQNAGNSVWLDQKKIKVGDQISKKLEEGISGCDFFCLVISEHSVNSKWVEREYRTALNMQLSTDTTPKILPLLIQDVELPKLLMDIKYADFSMDYNKGLKDLLDKINEQ